MAAPADIQVSTIQGYPLREVCKTRTTRLGIVIEANSAPASITSCTVKAAKGGTVVSIGSATVDGDEATIDLTTAHLSSLSAAVFNARLLLTWTFLVSGQPVELDYTEEVYVADNLVHCPVKQRDLIEAYPVLNRQTSYPLDPVTGQRQTTYHRQIMMGWRSVRTWLATDAPDKAPWLLLNPIVFLPLSLAYSGKALAIINMTQTGSDIWQAIGAMCDKDIDRLQKQLVGRFKLAGASTHGAEPLNERKPIASPGPGNVRTRDFGKS